METIRAVVEVPKGSNVKYIYEPSSGFFLLKKVLADGMIFPDDFGFIPGTKGQEGDSLDIIVISEFKNFIGCKIDCKLIGSIRAWQKNKTDKKSKIRNDRLFGIPVQSVIFGKVKYLKDLPEKLMADLQIFFISIIKWKIKLLKLRVY